MDFIAPAIQAYSENHTTPETALLQQLNRETHAKVLSPRMLSGHLQGRFLAMLSYMIRPQYILEIGTYTGYSALCLAEGLQEGGKLITIDINEELESFVRTYFEASGRAHQLDFRIGNARQIIPTLTESFDLVFIDADKPSYAQYFDLCIEKIRPGGFIIADNVLWSGKVVNTGKIDKDTQILLDFNQKVQQDDRVENILLPVRDGLMIVRKK
ncbi:MAG: O-methyltransferase [Spirosomataceae bacterium]